jgi:hypothetical protein
VFADLGRPLWREDGSVVYNCCWPSPAQSFSGPSPLGLVTIFYCLRFETSLFAASYDSQGHGGGIRSCLHTGNKIRLFVNKTVLKSIYPFLPFSFPQFSTLCHLFPLNIYIFFLAYKCKCSFLFGGRREKLKHLLHGPMTFLGLRKLILNFQYVLIISVYNHIY